MTDGLKAHHRAAIIATLAANHRVEQAVLFGSRAMGAHTVTSDVDVALFGQQLTLTDQAKLAAACEELPMAQSVDLVLHSTIDNPALVEHIRSYGVEWYCRGGSGSVVDLTESDGNVPAWRKIEDIVRIRQGRYMSPDQLSEIKSKDMPVPVWGANRIIGYTKEATYENAQALVTCRGNGCGLVQWSQGRANVSNNAMAIVLPKEDKDSSRYLYYTLLASDFSDVITGSAQPQTTMGHLNKKEVYWHRSRNQRKAIAHILGTLDDKIELNRKINETLEAMARALFKSWFVDFDPVRAKAEGRCTGLPDEISALFPDSFEDSELGEIPSGWGVKRLGDLLTLEKDSLTPGDTPEEIFSHYSIPAFDNGKLPAKESGASIKSNKYLIRDGVFLVSKLNPTMPRVWLPSASSNLKRICSTEFLVCRPSFSVGVPFSYLLAKSNDLVQRMGDLASGTSNSHQRVRPVDFMSLSVIKCDDRLLILFNKSIWPMLQKFLQARQENLLLSECRDILLPKLVSGELRLSK